ncbi:MAG: amylo-alpha-1,6-glucosidase [Candidatus Pacebacteria bacterium]|nr:amylo-alpha-1,6-glucosidase [Candidatus Paceibacterota bacterium]
MKVVHYFNEKNRLAKLTDGDGSFLLTNKTGGYLWWGGETKSRYQGWFFTPAGLAGVKMFRLVESIEIENAPAVEEVRNNFWNCQQKRGELMETFFLPASSDVFSYEVSEKKNLSVVLDVKESFDNRNDSRSYEIFYESGLTLVKYTQPDLGVPEIWLAIKSDNRETELIKKWRLKEYSYDRKRSSPPFERHVFVALKLIGAQRIIFAVALNKEEAITQAAAGADNLKILKNKRQKEAKKLLPFFNEPSIGNPELKMAYLCAKNSLQGLLVCDSKKKKPEMLYAGLPWFFQSWQRDTALSLKALSYVKPAAAKTIFEKTLVSIIKGEKNDSAVDGWGWLFKRSENFSFRRKFLLAAIEEFFKNGRVSSPKSFFLHYPKSTWMDSIGRAPYCLEMQALLLNAYRLGALNYEFWRKKFFYRRQEKEGRRYFKEKLWDGEILADGLFDNQTPDKTVRPNIFLAALAYPKLLTRAEWQKCFENALGRLWLEWGGLATLDRQNSDFQSEHTGENAASYHQGDSWFFINNLAGLMMAATDKKTFLPYIEKIAKASAHDILWQGIIGHHSELSSAAELRSEGCLCQAWSSAFYLELLKKLY